MDYRKSNFCNVIAIETTAVNSTKAPLCVLRETFEYNIRSLLFPLPSLFIRFYFRENTRVMDLLGGGKGNYSMCVLKISIKAVPKICNICSNNNT